MVQVKYIFIIINIFILVNFISFKKNKSSKKLKIEVISVRNEVNIGNNLIKYAISVVLSRLGVIPYIVASHYKHYNISFINKTTNLIIVKNFRKIKRNDYDING